MLFHILPEFALQSTMDYAIVTGASRGLGAAIVGRLLPSGTHIFAVSRGRNQELIDAAEASPSRLTWIEADLSDRSRATGLMEEIAGHIDVSQLEALTLINNAATVRPYGVIGAMNPGEIAETIELNVTAPTILTNAFVALFADAPGTKTVINVSSGASERPMAGLSVYSLTKAAINALTRAAAGERSADAGAGPGAGGAGQFRFFAVTPGKIDTPMQEAMREEGAGVLPDHETYIEWKESGALSDPSDAAARLLTLLTRDDFESGAFLHVRDLG